MQIYTMVSNRRIWKELTFNDSVEIIKKDKKNQK